jgi:hypothetical protein
MLPFTQHELFCRVIFAADSKIEYKRTTAIPKRTLFGTAVFYAFFSYHFCCILISSAYAPRDFWYQ